MTIDSSLAHINANIAKMKDNMPLSDGSFTLLAASKGQLPSTIENALHAGLRDFGENRVQEAADKWPQLQTAYSDVTLHLIGPLQTNKVKQAVALFDVIQTIDRPRLAEALAKQLIKTPKDLACYIQVNIGEEPQKAGVAPEQASQLLSYCQRLSLRIVGLMCIPPHDKPAAPYFALLRQMAERHGLKNLSMGMSDDYETALRMGSTCIRLGRALFGARSA